MLILAIYLIPLLAWSATGDLCPKGAQMAQIDEGSVELVSDKLPAGTCKNGASSALFCKIRINITKGHMQGTCGLELDMATKAHPVKVEVIYGKHNGKCLITNTNGTNDITGIVPAYLLERNGKYALDQMEEEDGCPVFDNFKKKTDTPKSTQNGKKFITGEPRPSEAMSPPEEYNGKAE